MRPSSHRGPVGILSDTFPLPPAWESEWWSEAESTMIFSEPEGDDAHFSEEWGHFADRCRLRRSNKSHSMKRVSDHIALRRAGKAETRALRKAAAKARHKCREDEQRFKWRHWNWFHNFGCRYPRWPRLQRNASKLNYSSPAVHRSSHYFPATGFWPALFSSVQARPDPVVPVVSHAAQPVAQSHVELGVPGTLHLQPKVGTAAPTPAELMQAYAVVAWWRTLGLLQTSFGREAHALGEDAATAKYAAELHCHELVGRVLACSWPRRRPRWIAARGLGLKSRQPLHGVFAAQARAAAALDKHRKGGRWQRRRAVRLELKQQLRGACRKVVNYAEAPQTVAKHCLQRMRRDSSRRRAQHLRAQRDAKVFEPESERDPRPTNSCVASSRNGAFDHGVVERIARQLAGKRSKGRCCLCLRRNRQRVCNTSGAPEVKGLGGAATPPHHRSRFASKGCVGVEGCAASGGAAVAESDVPAEAARLIPVWECLDEFQFARVPDDDGKVLIPAPQAHSQPEVADKPAFMQRFHERTGGIFEEIDWHNLHVIGGMVLACLTADSSDFCRNFAETDVDIYIVGLAGAAFKERAATLVEQLYRSATKRSLKAVVLRTPCTITLGLCRPSGEPLPNVQIVMSPFRTKEHLLFTTDIDCTGFGFDGASLLATPWARDAVAHRRIIARPEKYCIRGEWSTESRLFKYAARGFRVVDLGLRPDVEVPNHPEVASLAAEASAALGVEARRVGGGAAPMHALARKFERKLRDLGVNGAYLMLLARLNPGLRELLLFDVPLLPAGMGDKRLLAHLRACDASLMRDGYEGLRKLRLGHSKQHFKLRVLYPLWQQCKIKAVLRGAIEEHGPDSHHQVRSWYSGLV